VIRWRALLARALHVEKEILFTIVLAAGGLLLFVELSGDVLEGDTRTFDETILLAFRNPADPSDPIGPGWVEEMMRDVTALGSTVVLTFVSLGVAGFLHMTGKRGAALLVIAAVIGGSLLSSGLKIGFERARPDLVPHGAAVYTKSFPSGHSFLSAVVYLTLGALLARVQPKRRLKIYLLGLAALLTVAIGLSRVYLGVHWPTDVLAGWTVGATWALLCWLVALWLQSRGTVEEDKSE
jgi:undecaprenyl-diphosphatase